MIEGLRRAQDGMLPRITQQETLANNLANALTPGFKRDRVSFQALLQEAGTAGAAPAGAPVSLPGGPSWNTVPVVRPDLRPGALEVTGNPLDLALTGEAFFAVSTPAGERYTRAGNFTRNERGELALPDGARVLTENGPIQVDGEVAVSTDGQISVDGQPRGRLKLVEFPAGADLRHEGGTLWTSTARPRPATACAVKQGYLEGSNVNPVEEMVDMMNAYRSYEANIRSAQIQGDSLGQLINNVGRSK